MEDHIRGDRLLGCGGDRRTEPMFPVVMRNRQPTGLVHVGHTQAIDDGSSLWLPPPPPPDTS